MIDTNITHLKPSELADRLRLSIGTLANWRTLGIGPKFIKHGRVLYPIAEVELWEQQHLKSNTAA